MPGGYLVIMPEPRFSPLGNLPSPLISEVKLTSVFPQLGEPIHAMASGSRHAVQGSTTLSCDKV
jgi:hypothetical protein